MERHEDHRLSIQEAVRKIFKGDALGIPRSTIQTWMQRRIFVPAEPAPYRDPKGCRLDFSDLVTLGVLRLLTKVGVGYESLRPDRLGFKTSIGLAKMDADLRSDFEANKKRGRGIQGYLMAFDYKVHVRVDTSVLWGEHSITFRPSDSLNEEFFEKLREESNLWTPITLIPVRPLHDHIRAVLEGPPAD